AELRGDGLRLGRRAPGAGPAGPGAAAVSGGPAAGVTGARASGADGTRAAAGGDASGGVAPSLDELIALRSLALARGRVRHGTSGLRAQATSALRGRGMEYAESRAYAIDDDAR